jgi:predicted MFS family arabinose efflux permease
MNARSPPWPGVTPNREPRSGPMRTLPSYFRFVRSEFPLVGYGLFLTFFSSFGQTFLVSLFVPSFLAAFALTRAEFGSLYAAATLGSAFLLPWTGAWLDRLRLTRFSVGVILLMALSAFVLASAWAPWVLFVGLLGIRLSGQGLSAHAAMTAMARYYDKERGKALSLSGLGFPLGEAVLPLLVAFSIGFLGWRGSWLAVGVLALVFFAPTLVGLLRRSGFEMDPTKLASAQESGRGGGAGGVEGEGPPGAGGGGSWSRAEVLRDPRFWGVLPAALLSPFWVTGLFLYQLSIAEARGWSVTLMASAFLAYAGARVVAALGAGEIIDRASARVLLPPALIPMALAFGFVLAFDGTWVPFAYMSALGATVGLTATAKPALWAELYGVRHLGAIKSMMTTLMVVSTAAAPMLLGFALDAEVGLAMILLAGLGSVLPAMVLAWWVLRPGR